MIGILDIGSFLGTLYGTSSSGTTVSTNPLGDLAKAEANSVKDIALQGAQPDVARDLAAFRAAVAAAKAPAALLNNPVVLKVLLTANGLGDQVSYTALAQKALLSDTTDTTSLANTLPNRAWKATAATFDFANKGLTIIQSAAVLDTVANGYAEVLWRQSLDKATPGLSNALTFRSQASTITSVDQILGSATLRNVVLGALGIPPQIAFQDLGAQENAISTRLDITKFKDPKFVETFAKQYLIQANLAVASSTGATPLSAFGYGSSNTDDTSLLSNTLAGLAVQSQGFVV